MRSYGSIYPASISWPEHQTPRGFRTELKGTGCPERPQARLLPTGFALRPSLHHHPYILYFLTSLLTSTREVTQALPPRCRHLTFPGLQYRSRPIPPLISPLLPVPPRPDATLRILCAPTHPLTDRLRPAHLPDLHTWVRPPRESGPSHARPSDSAVPPPARPRAAMFTVGKWINPELLQRRYPDVRAHGTRR